MAMLWPLGTGWGAERVEITALEQVRDYIAKQAEAGAIDKSRRNWRRTLPVFPDLKFDSDSEYFVTFTTDRGSLKVRLFEQAAPRHVANLVYLVELGFYDGQGVQYIRPGQRIQAGCPIGDGRGTPGYTFGGEYVSGLSHVRAGLLSMANAGRDSDGCIFFITLAPMPWMDGEHTIFGEVVEGADVLQAIGRLGSKIGRPRQKVVIEKATVEEKQSPLPTPVSR